MVRTSLSRHDLESRQNLPQHHFSQIPTELISTIASYLPIHSAAALAFCNRRLYSILRKYCIILYSKESDGKTRYPREGQLFQQYLDRDRLDVYFCYSCKQHHFFLQDPQQKPTAKKLYHQLARRCPTSWYNTGRLGLHGADIRMHSEIATKIDRRGDVALDPNEYLSHAAIEEPYIIRQGSDIHGFILLDIRLTEGQIYNRMQFWMILTHDMQRLPGNNAIDICEHLDPPQIFKDVVENHQNEFSQHCDTCPTEIYAECKRLKDEHYPRAVILTKWQLIPQATILDEAWVFTPGNIRDVYEKNAKSPFTSICTVKQAWKAWQKDLVVKMLCKPPLHKGGASKLKPFSARLRNLWSGSP